MRLRFIFSTICLPALAAAALASCANEAKEEENASIVNLDKGVASPMSTPEMAGQTGVSEAQPVGIVGGAEAPAPEPAVEKAPEKEKPSAKESGTDEE